jgi:hypothetical protein
VGLVAGPEGSEWRIQRLIKQPIKQKGHQGMKSFMNRKVLTIAAAGLTLEIGARREGQHAVIHR